MLSETLESGLRDYAIGERIHRLRVAKGISLVELGEHSGLSSGMLSKIERGKLFPTLPTLLRIAMVFGVRLGHFFDDDSDRPAHAVVRRADRLRLPNRPGPGPADYEFESLDFPLPDRRMEAFLARFFDTGQPPETHQHPGAEVIYVIEGTLVLDLAGEEITLGAGDSIQFEADHPHSYRRRGAADCTGIVVVCR